MAFSLLTPSLSFAATAWSSGSVDKDHPIRANHYSEIKSYIDLKRSSCGMTLYNGWTSSNFATEVVPGKVIRANHILELRKAMKATATDPKATLTGTLPASISQTTANLVNQPIKASDLTDLRTALDLIACCGNYSCETGENISCPGDCKCPNLSPDPGEKILCPNSDPPTLNDIPANSVLTNNCNAGQQYCKFYCKPPLQNVGGVCKLDQTCSGSCPAPYCSGKDLISYTCNPNTGSCDPSTVTCADTCLNGACTTCTPNPTEDLGCAASCGTQTCSSTSTCHRTVFPGNCQSTVYTCDPDNSCGTPQTCDATFTVNPAFYPPPCNTGFYITGFSANQETADKICQGYGYVKAKSFIGGDPTSVSIQNPFSYPVPNAITPPSQCYWSVHPYFSGWQLKNALNLNKLKSVTCTTGAACACAGNKPGHAQECPGNPSPTSLSTSYTLSSACSATPKACEMVCDQGYTKQGNFCVKACAAEFDVATLTAPNCNAGDLFTFQNFDPDDAKNAWNTANKICQLAGYDEAADLIPQDPVEKAADRCSYNFDSDEWEHIQNSNQTISRVICKQNTTTSCTLACLGFKPPHTVECSNNPAVPDGDSWYYLSHDSCATPAACQMTCASGYVFNPDTEVCEIVPPACTAAVTPPAMPIACNGAVGYWNDATTKTKLCTTLGYEAFNASSSSTPWSGSKKVCFWDGSAWTAATKIGPSQIDSLVCDKQNAPCPSTTSCAATTHTATFTNAASINATIPSTVSGGSANFTSTCNTNFSGTGGSLTATCTNTVWTYSQSEDCASMCNNNGVCDGIETTSTCPSDCPASCIGSIPNFADICTGDDTNLASSFTRSLVSSCTSGVKCEYTCRSNYTLSGGICVPTATYSCTGNPPSNGQVCTTTDETQNLTANVANHVVDTCSTNNSVNSNKCEYTCVTGFSRNSSTGNCDAVCGGASYLTCTGTTGNIAGIYQGLFAPDTITELGAEGSYFITVAADNSFSGWVQMGYSRYTVAGAFTNGKSTFTFTRWNGGPVTVNLCINASGQVAGRVSGTNIQTNNPFCSTLTGSKKTTNPSKYAGTYTVVMPGVINSTTVPEGDSIGAVIIDATGLATYITSLSDSTSLSNQYYILQDGTMPVYVSLYVGKGIIFGYLDFNAVDGTNSSNLEGPTGTIKWIKLAGASTTSYPSGFNFDSTVISSKYTSPPTGTRILNLPSGVAQFKGGKLSANFNNNITLSTANVVTNQSANALIMTFGSVYIGPTVGFVPGSFSGSVTEPISGGQSRLFNGVVLQKQNIGYGYLAANASEPPLKSSEVIISSGYNCSTAPTNATICSNDDVGLTANTTSTVVASCTVGTKCEYTCNATYVKSGNTCIKCGNGTVDSGEQCDDGNTANSDGCSSTCQWETRTSNCTALADSTSQQYNTASSITQTCAAVSAGACTSWLPSTTPAYNATASTTACQYTCKSGYSWNGTACTVIQCSAQALSLNGTTASFPVTNAGSTATGTCATGSGTASATCSVSGSWGTATGTCCPAGTTYSAGSCISYCQNLPANSTACSNNTPPSSTTNYTAVASCINSGAGICQAQCDGGYSLQGGACVSCPLNDTVQGWRTGNTFYNNATGTVVAQDGATRLAYIDDLTTQGVQNVYITMNGVEALKHYCLTKNYGDVVIEPTTWRCACTTLQCDSISANVTISNLAADGIKGTLPKTTFGAYGKAPCPVNYSSPTNGAVRYCRYAGNNNMWGPIIAGTECSPTTYSCTGIPSNATVCSGANTGLTANTASTIVTTCGSAKCEFTCQTGYEKSGSTCVPANLIVNSDFESPVCGNKHTASAICNYSSIPGWSTPYPWSFTIDAGYLSDGSGNQSVLTFSVDSPTSQSVTTVPGKQYVFDFDIASASPNVGGVNTNVYWNNTLLGTISTLLSPLNGWRHVQYTVTATGTTSTIKFESPDTCSGGGIECGNLVDNVSLKISN